MSLDKDVQWQKKAVAVGDNGSVPDGPTVVKAHAFLDSVKDLLSEKDRKYGSSIANPVRIFSKASTTEQLLVRIDDKLSRLRTMGTDAQPDEDTIKDLVGYLAMLVGLRG